MRNASNRRIQAEKRAYLHEVKSQPCADCGGTFPPCVMDLHHRDEGEKLFNVGLSVGSVGWERLREEVAKCDVVCANCHRIRHFGHSANAMMKTDGE